MIFNLKLSKDILTDLRSNSFPFSNGYINQCRHKSPLYPTFPTVQLERRSNSSPPYDLAIFVRHVSVD